MPGFEPTIDLLFVYGTLRSEFDNPYSRRLRAEADFVGAAEVAGALFHVAHYPGYRPEPAGRVRGEVYRLRSPERTLADLDEYEGEEYLRVRVRLLQPENEAWLYQYARPVPLERRIVSGDFTQP